jgi:hypothetical protein
MTALLAPEEEREPRPCDVCGKTTTDWDYDESLEVECDDCHEKWVAHVQTGKAPW